MEKKKSKAKQVLSIVLILVVIFGGCVIAVGIYAKSAITEGTVEFPAEPEKSLTPEPNRSEFSEYINKMLEKATDSSKVKADIETSLSIDNDSVMMNAPKSDVNTLKFIINSLATDFAGFYPSHNGKFEKGINALPTVLTEASDMTDFTFKRGEIDKNNEETLNEDKFNYFDVWFKGTSPTENNNITRTFNTQTVNDVIGKIESDYTEMFETTSFEVLAESCEINGKLQRLSDRLEYINFISNYNIKLNVSFKNDYSVLGEKEIFFSYKAETKYTFTWAGVEFDEDTVILSPNEEEPLSLTVTISDDAESEDCKINFNSSDESIVSVDKDGNIKSVSLSEKPVTISVTLEYLGNVYTDSCDVYSIEPVKKIKTQPEELAMKIGEKQKLSVKITPEDATVKDVMWFTENDTVASVSDDGTVTALNEGTVKVYAVSVDGHFRSSCVITITGGEANAD